MESLIDEEVKTKVSSTLNDSREYSKQNMFNDDKDTCWQSDSGTPQWILMQFGSHVILKELFVVFQGGFCAKEIQITALSPEWQGYQSIATFYPNDSSEMQKFLLPDTSPLSRIKITFPQSTDLYGRIIIYQLDLKGLKNPPQ